MTDIPRIGLPDQDTCEMSWGKCRNCYFLSRLPTQDTGARFGCEITGDDLILKECIAGDEIPF